VSEADFLAKLDAVAVDAFDDQCTGANPRYPLISEFRTILLDSFYGRAFTEPKQGDEAEVAATEAKQTPAHKAKGGNGKVSAKAEVEPEVVSAK
jgi:acetaldehyde dehydrogenase/alcohol dehydrogenase